MLARFFRSLEETQMTFALWLAGFASVVMVRFFIESFSNPDPNGYLPSDPATMLHYGIFYVGDMLITIVILRLATGIDALRLARLALFLLPIIWVGPLFDLASGGAGMSYLLAPSLAALAHDFITYFGPITSLGVTSGIRIELAALLTAIATYIYMSTRSVARTIAAVLASYAGFFFAMALPSAIIFFVSGNPANTWPALLNSSLVSHVFLHPSVTSDAYRTAVQLFDATMAQWWFLLITFFGAVWLYLARRDVLVAAVRNVRPERLAHYLLFTVFGAALAYVRFGAHALTVLDLLMFAVALVTVAFVWSFAVAVNDLVDIPIDAVSNKERPLVTGALSQEEMRDVALGTALMTLLGAFSLGSYASFFVLVYLAAFWAYSAPPLRLKRIPVFSSATIGLATLACFTLGFFLASPEQSLFVFPARIGILIFLAMTVGSNFRDLKDIEGDRAAGITTLATLLGKYAGLGIGALAFLSCILVPVFLPVASLWVPALVAGTGAWVALARGWGERSFFAIYFVFLVAVVWILA